MSPAYLEYHTIPGYSVNYVSRLEYGSGQLKNFRYYGNLVGDRRGESSWIHFKEPCLRSVMYTDPDHGHIEYATIWNWLAIFTSPTYDRKFDAQITALKELGVIVRTGDKRIKLIPPAGHVLVVFPFWNNCGLDIYLAQRH